MGKINLVRFDRIKIIEDLFIRDGYDGDAVERYKEAYRTGVKLPPVKVQKKKEKLVLFDGFHRMKARGELIAELSTDDLENLDLETVEVEECDISDEDLLIEAVRANADFGVPLTKRERNKIVFRLRALGKTQQEIADVVGLSQNRISEILALSETDNTKDETDKNTSNGDQRSKIKSINTTEIIEACILGEQTQDRIGEPYGISDSRVSQIFTDFKNDIVQKYLSGFNKVGICTSTQVKISTEQLEELLVDHGELSDVVVGIDRMLCGDVFDIGKQIPDKSTDLVVVDPPYNISGAQKVMKRDGEIVSADIAGWDYFSSEQYEEMITKLLLEIKRILKPTGSFYIFLDKAYSSIVWHIAVKLGLIPKNIVHWRKTNPTPNVRKNNYTSTVEHILFGVAGKTYTFNFTLDPSMHNIYECAVARRDTYPHPTAKPVDLLTHLIKISSNQGDVVWDGFAGRGSTAIACIRTKRQWYNIELETEYFKTMEKWVAEELK